MTGVRMTFPFGIKQTLAYIGYLLAPRDKGGRGLQGKSVEKYLSALRMVHMQRGFFSPWIRPEIVSLITKGAANRDQIKKRVEGKLGRLPMTPQLMWDLKLALKEASFRRSRKRIIWVTATMCWAGAMRIHELLAREAEEYDPLTTMLTKDIVLQSVEVEGHKIQTLKVTIKHPKEERLSLGVVLDIFESGDFMCPVQAFQKWMKDKVVRLQTHKPLFRLADGRNYTGAMFNKDLKYMLSGIIDYDKGGITAHSMRAGLATFMAKAGYSDNDIMRVGRWKSEAFKSYIKTPREIRAKLAEELARKVANSMQLQM